MSPPPRLCHATALAAIRCLHEELTLYPKPGLVSLVDTGSHADMNAATFMRSLFSLRHYFARICKAGFDDAAFVRLKALGIDAEMRMLEATGGINTHRGAIFSLGLLCAATGRAAALSLHPTPSSLRSVLLARWGEELACHGAQRGAGSNGQRAASMHGAGGAREEGALGLPSVFEVGLPALRSALADGRGMYCARVDVLFALMAQVSDTNVLHRGGVEGADIVRTEARRFVDLGGTANPGWQALALRCHKLFIGRRLSPGGAADLLAASCLVHALTVDNAP